MTGEDHELTDADREEILRLVLSEADGKNVAEALGTYPVEARGTFRRAAFQAGLVQAGGITTKGTETVFEGRPKLSARGRTRLRELNERRGKGIS